MKTLSTIAALLALSWTAGAWAQASVGDVNRGKQKVTMCQGCHGIEGWCTAYPELYSVPRISGQHATYLANALKAYRSGDRNHPSMKAMAAQLSDQDIADLAAFYAQPPVTTAGK